MMDERVVMSSLVRTSPIPKHRFARLKPLSTSIRSRVILMCGFSFFRRRILLGTSQGCARNSDILAFAESNVPTIAADLSYDRFKILSCLVEQIDVLRICNVLRCAGCAEDQSSLIFRLCCFRFIGITCFRPLISTTIAVIEIIIRTGTLKQTLNK